MRIVRLPVSRWLHLRQSKPRHTRYVHLDSICCLQSRQSLIRIFHPVLIFLLSKHGRQSVSDKFHYPNSMVNAIWILTLITYISLRNILSFLLNIICLVELSLTLLFINTLYWLCSVFFIEFYHYHVILAYLVTATYLLLSK